MNATCAGSSAPKDRRSLRTLVGLSIAIAQILAVAVLSVPVLDGRDTIIYEQARQMARARARLGAALLEQELARLTPREIEAALSAFLTSPDVLEARIVRSGAVLGRVSAPVAAVSLAADGPELTEAARGFTVSTPLHDAKGGARLEFSFSTEHLGRRISDVTWRVLLLVCLALALGLAGAYVLSLRLIRRLEGVAVATAAIAQGDVQLRLPEDGPSEVASLSRSFNAMVAAVALSQSQLEQANATLERRVAERTRQLVEAERLITVGEMSAQLAHDMRNPLATASLNAELLLEELAGCDCARRAGSLIETLGRSIARADLALGEYLGFSGLERIQRAPADLNAEIRGELDALVDWLSSKHIAVAMDFAEGLPAVSLDTRRFRLGLRCLVRHAAGAMPRGGTLSVSSRPESGAIQVRFTDTGGPIDEAVRKDLFKLFCGLRPNSGGPGLRLAREIVQIHSGSLDLESTGASGSTYLIVLPASG